MVCQTPVWNVKVPRPSDVPKSELQITCDWLHRPVDVVGMYAYTAMGKHHGIQGARLGSPSPVPLVRHMRRVEKHVVPSV